MIEGFKPYTRPARAPYGRAKLAVSQKGGARFYSGAVKKLPCLSKKFFTLFIDFDNCRIALAEFCDERKRADQYALSKNSGVRFSMLGALHQLGCCVPEEYVWLPYEFDEQHQAIIIDCSSLQTDVQKDGKEL